VGRRRAARLLPVLPDQEAAMTSPTFFENLEDRLVFNSTVVVIGSGGLFGSDPAGLNNGVAIVFSSGDLNSKEPAGEDTPLRLPPVTKSGVTTTSTGSRVNLRGLYRGSVNLLGEGSTRFVLNVTRQRGSSLTATLRFPALNESFSDKARVSFLGNGRFTVTFANGDEQVTLNGRRDADGTLSGTLSGQLDSGNISGPFSVRLRGLDDRLLQTIRR
jgi:hypothetical protein